MIVGIFLLRNYLSNAKCTCIVIAGLNVVYQLGHMHCYCAGIIIDMHIEMHCLGHPMTYSYALSSCTKLSVHLISTRVCFRRSMAPKKSAGCNGSDYSIADKASDRNIDHLIHCASDIRAQGDHPAVENRVYSAKFF